MANRLTDLQVEFVSIVDRAAVRDPQNPTEPQRFLVWKSDTTRDGEDPTTTPEGDTMTPEEMAAALAKAETDRDEALEAAKTAKAEADAATVKVAELEKAATVEPAEPAAIDKSELPEPVRLALEKAEQERDAYAERITKAEDLAKAERDIRVNREYVAKAATFHALPVDAEKFGPVLKAAAENMSADEFSELDRILKAADAQIASSGLFKEHGRSGDPAGSDSADESLVTKAAELRKADTSLSEAKAMERAMRENPELASTYLASVR
jgi:hypothetical protein